MIIPSFMKKQCCTYRINDPHTGTDFDHNGPSITGTYTQVC